MKTISIVTSGRPQYLKQVIESWRQVKLLKQYKLLAFIEPGNHAQTEVDLFNSVTPLFAEVSIIVNKQMMGLSPNTHQALKTGLKQCSGFHIHTEDDILLAPDAIEFLEWANHTYLNDKKIFQATAYCANNNSQGGSDWYKVVRKSKFGPLCWGTWTDRLIEIVQYGDKYWNTPGIHGEWDVDTNHRVRRGRDSVWPLVSRSLHIGLTGLHSQGPPGSKQYNASDITKRNWAINIPKESIYTEFTETEDYYYGE